MSASQSAQIAEPALADAMTAAAYGRLHSARNPIADLFALADAHDQMLAADPSNPWLSDVGDALGINETYGFVSGVRAILSNRLETFRGLYFVPGSGDLDSMTGGEFDYVEIAASEMLQAVRHAMAEARKLDGPLLAAAEMARAA